ncbi:MAG: type IV pilin protein [Candidatus Sumerlaeia bacterium]
MNICAQSSKKRGVTMTELLVVVVIISLLATIAVPVYLNKVEQSRIATARQEVRLIAEAEEACGILHGFYVPLQMLDDLIYDQNTQQSSNPRTDDLDFERQAINPYLIDVTLNVEDQRGFQVQLNDWTTDAKVSQLYLNWAGPFLNPNRVAFRDDIALNEVSENPYVHYDFPLDPWGVPYRFYSPIGIIGTNAYVDAIPGTSNSTSWQNFSDGLLSTQDDKYDRFAIVSYGPDRESGNAIDSDESQDDIYYTFGAVYTESSWRAFY